MTKQTQNIINVSLTLLAIYLYSFTANNIETEILGFNSFKFLISMAVLIQFLIFVPSFLFQTEKFYDLTGSLTYISVTSIAYFSLDNPTTIDTILYLYVIVWAGRLGIFLFRRINKDGKDERFDKAKKKFFWFLQYWMGQAAWVVFTAGASILAILSPVETELGVLAFIGIFLWWSGFLIEVIADNQKRKFRETSDPKTEFISNGLWARSRHPNYFGEITLWIGMAVLSLSSLSGIEYVTAIVSPIFVYLLLIKAEGVPMLERIAEERYGDLPEYQQYKENTPVFMMKIFK
jgi:steroid 5-alpha reductase family enzyme